MLEVGVRDGSQFAKKKAETNYFETLAEFNKIRFTLKIQTTPN